MKALKFNQTGSLKELKVVSVEDPIPQSGEVIVRVLAAAINPSDIKNVLGRMKETKIPRIPGRDFAGIVISDSKWKGKSVFGTGGPLGFSKDGTHAEFVAVPESALVELPKKLSFSSATAMSLSYLTAWQAIVVTGQLKAQETVLITGASGAVGGAAVRIAKYLGANVIGTVSSNQSTPNLSGSIQLIFLNQEKLGDAINKLTHGHGVDLILDVVGGPLFEPCLECLSKNGRQVTIACTGDPRVSFNLVDFYHKQARLLGVDTLKLSIEECANILKALVSGMENGLFIPQAIDEISLIDAPQAYEEIQNGKTKNKKVIVFPKN
jgi:NADPH:quinone reductase